MNYILEFGKKLSNTVMSIYNKGCIDRNIVDSFIKLISETYVYRIKPIDKKKEESETFERE